jgi:ubiquinone/menaquinone biosynthesis C-methylase UbiE
MNGPNHNRFQDLFEEGKYIVLKNYLYNYLLRKRAVEKNLHRKKLQLILEIGSGLSPMITNTNRIIYSDLSLTALQILKRTHGKGCYVAADVMFLPFKSGVFSHAICSEVLEHLEDDRTALKELCRAMRPWGSLIVTFPHRRFYFANDDRFVNHFRRYELTEMEDRLKEAGLKPMYIEKVLGPLEKVTMCSVILCFSMIQKFKAKKTRKPQNLKLIKMSAPLFKWANRFYIWLPWLDAKLMPRALSTTLLIAAGKNQRDN